MRSTKNKAFRAIFLIFLLTNGMVAQSDMGDLNIVSITIDDLNAYATIKSQYPGTIHTPNIDRLANQGVAFVNAFAPVALCNPSRSAVLSGQYPADTGIHDNSKTWYDSLDAARTLPAVLKSAGYYTSIIGKVFHTNVNKAPAEISNTVADEVTWNVRGWNGNAVDNPFRTGVLGIPEENHGDFINAEAAADFITNHDGQDPFALFVGFYKPHLDWVVPQEYYDLYPIEDIEFPYFLTDDLEDVPDYMKRRVNDYFHEDILEYGFWKQALQGYFASISFADAMLGKVLDAIDASGRASDTVILLWSDHGYHLGDKDSWHKFTLWDEAGRAPLIIAVPDSANTGERVEQVVELVDIYPTVLDILEVPFNHNVAGGSLTPFLRDPQRQTNGTAVTNVYGSVSLRTNEYRYTRYEDGSEELYNVATDPNQYVNLADNASFAAVKADLLETMQTHPALQHSVLGTTGDLIGGANERNFIVAGANVSEATGGSLDDTYFVSGTTTQINELQDGGNDTVYVTSSYTLPENVENLILKLNYGYNKILVGNDDANYIHGTSVIHGQGGDDTLLLRRMAGTVDGGAGNDVIHGSQRADHLIGGPGNDRIDAHSGDDTFVAGLGSDYLNGSNGFDIVDYSGIPGPVNIDLTLRQTDLGDGNFDQLISIEAAIGTASNDSFIGNAVNNTFWVGGGADTVVGGAGIDTVVLPLTSSELLLLGYEIDGFSITFFYQKDGTEHSVSVTDIEKFLLEDGQYLTKMEMLALARENMIGQVGQLTYDFDGDGSMDLLFEHNSNNALSVVDGVGSGFQIGFTPPISFDVIPTPDLNGDTSSDLLFRRPDGFIFSRNGHTGEVIGEYGIRNGHELIGIADFDNDGGSDLLFWRESDRALFVIDGNGGYQTSLGINDVADVYVPGDLNGNGTADVLMRYRDGRLFSREGASSRVITGYGNRADLDLLGAADFDGDGDLDLLFQKRSNAATFAIDGASGDFQVGFGPQPNADINFGGDLNGNGSSDLIIREASGIIHARDGSTGRKMVSYGNRAGQDLLAVADFDGDNGQDLLFRSSEDDRVFVVNGEGGFQLALGIQSGVDLHVVGDINGNGTADVLYAWQNGNTFSRDGERLQLIRHYGNRTGQTLINGVYDQYRVLNPEGVWTPPVAIDMFSW
jgi:arylsulfatase A-like enzyme